ncbi:MAG: sulfite exporter TauE/SafE family protein [Candidatus Pacebacteria bacterium]|nr:sulfite exporter TauE/SafE family protein [Candidatus Paceibacterota bacterium]
MKNIPDMDQQYKENKEKIKEHTYFVKGMHCASCEILIEKKLLELNGVKSVEASTNSGEVVIEYEGEAPRINVLNKIFQKENYVFSDKRGETESRNGFDRKEFFITFGIGLLVIFGFIGLIRLGLSGLISVNSSSSLITFFVFGLLAGISTCAALVGGLVLSMSKQWLELYPDNKSTFTKLQPHLMFNVGRIVSYAVLGAALGMLGGKLQISLKFTSFLVIVVSVMMNLLALQMLGLKAFRKFQFTMPRFITRRIADESNFRGRYMPFLMGALTFFLPCGFTITAQGLALLSGSALQGALIMLFFALGTLPMLLTIGFSTINFSKKPHLSFRFLKVAGFLVLFFALYNINSQLNVMGVTSLNDIKPKVTQSAGKTEEGLAPIINGKQLLKMEASSRGYNPDFFKIKVGIPVRWEITDVGTSGCTNAVISRNLFEGEIPLTPGQTSVKEFTPTKAGRYKFSCWMGMVSGMIEVIDEKNQTVQAAQTAVVSSGARGCSCGCSGR